MLQVEKRCPPPLGLQRSCLATVDAPEGASGRLLTGPNNTPQSPSNNDIHICFVFAHPLCSSVVLRLLHFLTIALIDQRAWPRCSSYTKHTLYCFHCCSLLPPTPSFFVLRLNILHCLTLGSVSFLSLSIPFASSILYPYYRFISWVWYPCQLG